MVQTPPDSSASHRGDPLVEHFRLHRDLSLPDSLTSPFDLLFDDEVKYSGDTIRFRVRDDQLTLRGHGKMDYGESALESEEIDYYSKRDLVVATGAPTLSDQRSQVVGQRMTYRTDEREGMVYQGKTELDGGYYYGEQVKKLPDDALLVKDGDYTTCDHDPPHYTFHSKKMKLVMKESAVARPVILRIYQVPVLGIPFYFFPLQSGRRSGILVPDFEFGFNRNVGRFAKNLGYYWAISDYMDAKAWIDFYDRGPELEFNGEYRYAVRYLLNGSATGSYLNQQSGDQRAKHWKFAGSHVQNIGDGGRFTMRADFKSDATYVQDFNSDAGVDERLNRQLRSSASYTHSWSGGSVSASADRTQYLDAASTFGSQERVERVPGVSLTLNRFPLGRAPDDLGRGGRLPWLASTTFGPSFRFQRDFTKFSDGSFRDNSAAQGTWSLSDSRNVGYLRLSPGLSGNVAWFHKDARGEYNGSGATWSASLSATTTLYGTMPGSIGPLAGLRHVVRPSVSYSYQPDFPSLSYVDSLGVKRARFTSVGGIGLSGSRVSSMSFSLDQSLHTKWRSGETVVKKENVLSWSTGASYNFQAPEGTHPLSQLSNSVRFRPFSTFDASYSATIDPYQWTNERYSVSATVRVSNRTFASASPADTTQSDGLDYGEFGQADLNGNRSGQASAAPWSVTANYNFTGGFGQKRSSLDLRSSLQPSAGWSVSVGAYYDLEKKEFVSHSLSLARDLHCWQFRFSRDTSGGYRFNISIKDVPEVKYDSEKRSR
ncbi:MAG: putative LPS assembly protein LptD [Candidatus Eisenbacteria bacterium]